MTLADDGFTREDFAAALSPLLSGHEPILKAGLSNNFNVIIAALRRCAAPTSPAPSSYPAVEEVKIKPLEWHGEPDWCFADTPVGHYTVSKRTNPDYWEMSSYGRDRVHSQQFDTAAAAKAAAEADRAARIVSELDLPTEPGPAAPQQVSGTVGEAEVTASEQLCRNRAMAQWEASLKRPDLTEKDRVRGAVDAALRQAYALGLTAALRRVDPDTTSPVDAGGVKALEWSDPWPNAETDRRHVAVSLGLAYFIDHEDDGWLVTTHYWGCGEARRVGFYGNLSAAKEAAQADYEARILSALNPSPSPAVDRAAVLEEGNGWFKLHGDTRLGRCATEGCGGQATWRLEAGGVGSDYCSGCSAAIRNLASAAARATSKQGETR